jgi:hypothetical protein
MAKNDGEEEREFHHHRAFNNIVFFGDISF